MKRIVAVILTLVLLVGTAACGKENADPAEMQAQSLTQDSSVYEEWEETEPVQEESTIAEDADAQSSDEPDMFSYVKYDDKTGTLTISGVEEFRMPSDYDVSSIRHIVIADDVLSADLDIGDREYKQLETLACDRNCSVSLSASKMTDSPFFRNSANWTDGVLYTGSVIAAINKDAPKVCRLKSNTTKIEWNVKEDIQRTAPQIERFEIAKENEDYQTDNNGVLYKNGEIELYPPASPLETYDLPDSVSNLNVPAAKNLKTIHISANASLNNLYHGEKNDAPLTSYRVDPGHPFLYAKDGVLFRKETYEDSDQTEQIRTILMDYPRDKSDTEYRIPDNTNQIGYGAFQDSTHLETLYVLLL